MEQKDIQYCAIAAVLGIISAAVGFAGELTRVKDSEVYIVDYECIYPSTSSPALALGIVAAVFTIITRIYLSVSCCRSGPNVTPIISKLFFLFSWKASMGAVVLLLAAGLNNREGLQADSYGNLTCYVVKPGIFAAGAILALLSAVFGIVGYIITLSSTTQTTTHPSIGLPAAHANVYLEKYPQQYTHQQYPPQQYPPQPHLPQQQYPPQPHLPQQQYPPHHHLPHQYPPQHYPPHQ